MGLAAILAALWLTGFSPVSMNGRDASYPGFASELAQEAGAAGQNSQNPSTDQTPEKAADQKQSDSKAENTRTPTAQKAEEANSQKLPGNRSAPGGRKRRSGADKAPAADGGPRKVVVHQGGTSEPIAQILPGITAEEASHQRQSAEQLLAAAESSLKELAARPLKPKQQDLVVQIRQYLDGARSALKESDIQRAHTLALKAYLLSDDLVKH
jgi:hypothetical protein